MATNTQNALKINYRDGSQNTIQLYPATEASAPMVIVSPAMGVRASYYKQLAQSFSDQGFHACTVDYRGTGASSVRASRKVDFGYEELVLDLEEVVAALRKEFPQSKQYLLGHSLGGQIGALAISRFPKLLDGLVLIASCMVYYKGWEGKGQGRIKFGVWMFGLISKLWGYFPGKQVGFGGREARTVIGDWKLNGMKGIYAPKKSSFNYEAALKKFAAPVLAMSLKGDNFAPKKAVANLVAKIASSPNHQHKHISSQDAGVEKLTHFNWAKHPDFFVQEVIQWIRER